jgi:hypothetical protein
LIAPAACFSCRPRRESARTGGGVVERNIEIDDDRRGFVVADELNPQKARVLLLLALTRTREAGALQEIFLVPRCFRWVAVEDWEPQRGE